MYDEFVTDIERDKNLEPELDEVFSIIEDIADNKLLPKGDYRRLHLSNKLGFTAFEAKTKHLRVYLFHDSGTGQIIICGGLKKNQDKDIDRVERIIKEYSAWKLESQRRSNKK